MEEKMKSITFAEIQEICKYVENDTECDHRESISSECVCSECPIWNDLVSSEKEY